MRSPFAISRRDAARRIAAMLALAGVGSPGLAQIPPGPLKIIVGFPPGGGFDTLARVLADKLKDELGRTVIVDNRPGVGGRVAVDALKAAPPDGSVVMLGPDALTSLYTLVYRKLNYDPRTDLVPISMLVEFPYAVVAGPNPPVKTLAEFVKWAKENPMQANYGHAARGSPHYFLGLMLSDAIGVKLTDVPFQGSAPMMTNLMGGQISSGMDLLSGQLLEYHKAGKLRILAVSSPKRIPQLPDVPTLSELGYPKMVAASTAAMYAPAKTPASVVTTWNRALEHALQDPRVKERLLEMGFVAAPSSPEDVTRRSASDIKFWEPIVKATGFTAD